MNLRQTVITLAHARKGIALGDHDLVAAAFKDLDDADLFATLDGYTDHASWEDVLAEAETAGQPRKDPAEWGDLSGYASAFQVGDGNQQVNSFA